VLNESIIRIERFKNNVQVVTLQPINFHMRFKQRSSSYLSTVHESIRIEIFKLRLDPMRYLQLLRRSWFSCRFGYFYRRRWILTGKRMLEILKILQNFHRCIVHLNFSPRCMLQSFSSSLQYLFLPGLSPSI